MRIFTNISGNIEGRSAGLKRQSPSIEGVRVTPGSLISFSDKEWNALPQSVRNELNLYVASGIFSLEEHNEAIKVQEIKPVAFKMPEPEPENKVDVLKQKTEKSLLTPEPEPKPESEKTEESQNGTTDEPVIKSSKPPLKVKTLTKPKKPVKKPEPESEPEFDYEAFLKNPVKKVIGLFEALDLKPSVAKILEAEQKGLNRSGVIGYFRKLGE